MWSITSSIRPPLRAWGPVNFSDQPADAFLSQDRQPLFQGQQRTRAAGWGRSRGRGLWSGWGAVAEQGVFEDFGGGDLGDFGVHGGLLSGVQGAGGWLKWGL